MSVAVILLAAGGSNRLGSPKQLLTLGGKTLLRRAAETAAETGCKPVVVVLGALFEAMRAELEGLDVRIVENLDWQRGMGGSVQRGMEALDEAETESTHGTCDGVLLMLCDQPRIRPVVLRQIVETFEDAGRADAIVGAGYGGTVGVPVVFGRAYFEELRSLPADAGAKGLLRKYASGVTAVHLPEAAVDVDTREQYEKLVGPS